LGVNLTNSVRLNSTKKAVNFDGLVKEKMKSS